MSSQKKKKILYVKSECLKDAANACSEHLSKDLNIELESVNTIHDIFSMLSDPSFNPDAIVIAVEDFYQIKGIDVFDIVNTLSTLIKCTIVRSGNKTKKRSTELFALVGDQSDTNLIKGLISMPNVHLAMRYGGSFTYEDIKKDVQRYLFNQNYETPKKIIDIIKPKKEACSKQQNQIILSPRQTQIFNLVVNRGVSNKVIAKILNLSESTVKLHMSSILKKYGVRSRTQLAVFAHESNKSFNINITKV